MFCGISRQQFCLDPIEILSVASEGTGNEQQAIEKTVARSLEFKH